MSEHTKTPWSVGPRHVVWCRTETGDGRRMHIPVAECCTSGEWADGPSNAAFIVRACNSHDALVEALEVARVHLAWRIRNTRTFSAEMKKAMWADLNQIDTALRIAKGDQSNG